MADAFRGLTIRLGADARPLQSALNSIQSSASAAQKQLRAMEKALKFDSTNVRALDARLELASDKARLTARAASNISVAMRQAAQETVEFSAKAGLASGKLDKVAAATRDVYSQTQRISAERTHVNAELQHMYDGMKKVVAEAYRGENAFKLNQERVKRIEESLKKAGVEGKNSLQVADRYVKQLQTGLSGSADQAAKARNEIYKLIRSAGMSESNGLAKLFNLDSGLASASKLVSIFKRLRDESGRLKSDLASIQAVEGFRAMRNELLKYESALREASYEEARFRAEYAAMSSAEGISKAVFEMKRFDNAVSESVAHAKSMSAAFDALPKTMESARAKVVATKNAQDALLNKATQLRVAISKIESENPFAKMAAETKNVHMAFEKATQDAAEFGAQMKMAEARVESLKKKVHEASITNFIGSKSNIDEVTNELKQAEVELTKISAKARSANEALETMAAARQLQSFNAELAETNTRLAALNTRASAFGNMAGNLRTMGYGLYSTVTPAIMMAGRYAIQAADDVDSAYRDMRKTVQGTEEQFAHLRSAALEFGRTHVTSADAILEIEAIGGQLAIATENLEKFATVVSNLDIATNLDVETISQNMGQLSNIMRDMNQDLETGPGSLEAFSDSLVRLGNNSAAQEDKIMNVMMRIASMGTISGMTTPDLLALSTAVAASGQGSEAAGTAISRSFSQIEAAVGKGGDKLDKFAKVADMSAGEFAAAWGEKPMEAFTQFIIGLKRVDEEGGSVANTLSELGINSVRQRQTLMNLTTTTDVLTEALIMSNDAWNGVGDSWGAAGDAAREAERKSEGFSGQIQIMKNAFQELAVVLLDAAVPMIKKITGFVQGLAAAVSGMPDWMKSMIIRFTAFTALLSPALIMFGALADGISKVGAAVETARGIAMLGKAFKLEGIESSTAALARMDAALQKNSTQLARNRTAIANVERSQAISAATKQRYIESLNREGAALTAQREKLMASKAGYEAAASGAAKLKTALKFAAGTIGFMAAVEAIGMIVSAIGQAIEKAEQYKQATVGLGEASQKFTASLRDVESGANSQANATKSALDNVTDYRSAVDKAIQGNVELAETFENNFKTANTSSSLAESYANKIIELSEASELTAEQQALLNRYVAAFNQITGSSVEVVDAYTGALNVSADALKQYVELSKTKAYTEATKKNAEAATMKAAEHQATYNQLLEQEKSLREEMHSKKFISSSWLDQFEMAGYTNRLGEVRKQMNELKPVLDEANKASENMWAEYERQVDSAINSTSKLGGAVKGAGDDMSALKFDVDASDEELEELSNSLEQLAGKFPQFGDMFAKSGLDVQQFSDLLSRELGMSMEEVASGMEDMANKVSDGFNRIEVNAEASLEKYMETLEHNKQVTADWSSNLKSLYERSSDEVYQAWVRSIAEMGPEYAQVVADMTKKGTEELVADAKSWQDAYNMGPGFFLDGIGWTSQQVQTKVGQMVDGTESKLSRLKTIGIDIVVDDNGTIRTTEENLTTLDRKRLANKGFAVSDDGTIYDMTEKIGAFDVVEVGDKIFFVSDDGTIYDEMGRVSDLNNTIAAVPRNIRTVFYAEDYVSGVISDIRSKMDSINGHSATLHILHSATGNIFPNQAIRAIPRHASGGINGIVTRPMLTNIGWVGEDGAEALLHMRNAGGAVVPLTNRHYVRPFARAVASEMSGGRSTVNNVTYEIKVNASGDGDEIARQVTKAIRAQELMRGRR